MPPGSGYLIRAPYERKDDLCVISTVSVSCSAPAVTAPPSCATSRLRSSSTSRSPPRWPRRSELRPYVEKLITLAKHGGLSNRRLAHARLLDEAQLVKLFEVSRRVTLRA
jgi:hypothetical protein